LPAALPIYRQAHPLGELHDRCEIESEILRVGIHGRERVADEYAAGNGKTGGVERSELGARVKRDIALVVDGTDDELAVAAGDRGGPNRLQAHTDRVLSRIGPVDRRALDRIGRGNRRAVRVEDQLLLVVLFFAHESRQVLALFEVRVVAVVRRDIAAATENVS